MKIVVEKEMIWEKKKEMMLLWIRDFLDSGSRAGAGAAVAVVETSNNIDERRLLLPFPFNITEPMILSLLPSQTTSTADDQVSVFCAIMLNPKAIDHHCFQCLSLCFSLRCKWAGKKHDHRFEDYRWGKWQHRLSHWLNLVVHVCPNCGAFLHLQTTNPQKGFSLLHNDPQGHFPSSFNHKPHFSKRRTPIKKISSFSWCSTWCSISIKMKKFGEGQ